MIIKSEHKLCRAFSRLFQTRNILKLCALYTARVNDVTSAQSETRTRKLPLPRRALYDWATGPLKFVIWLKYCWSCVKSTKDKKKDIRLSPPTKAPTSISIEISIKRSDNTKTPQKTSITQRLRTGLGRSVLVAIATELVWLNRFTGS